MRNTYLCLYPDTFWFDGKNKMLLYNSLKNKYLDIEKDDTLTVLQDKLMRLENLYSVQLDESLLTQYSHLWNKIVSKGLGEMIQSTETEKPVSYPPVLKMNQSMETIQYDYQKRQAGYILQYLYEVTVHLSGHSPLRKDYSKQTIYPLSHPQKLSPARLRKWFGKTKGGALKTVNFLGTPGILAEYSEVFQFLRELGTFLNYYILWEDFLPVRDMELIPPDFNKIILYTGNTLKKIDPAYDAVCLIENEEEIHQVEQSASDYANTGKSIELIPVYTGENERFFKECIYTSKEELLTCSLSKQDIFARMELNTNYFGKLILLPDGRIYSNLNTDSLGSLDDSLYEIIFKELEAGKNWKNIRSEEPCRKCRFKWLCPPISNYEFVIGQYNLCTVDEREH